MNRFLFLTLALLQGCVAYAAAPGTAAFNPNQFTTNNNRIALKDGLILTNLNVVTQMTISDGSSNGGIFESPVADGASAVAFQFNSTNVLHGTEGDFKTAIQYINGPTLNATNRTFRVRPDGGLVLGSDADASGVANEAIGAIEISRNVANGDNPTAEIYMENKSNSDYDIFGSFQVDVSVDETNPGVGLIMDSQAEGESTYRLYLESSNDDSQIIMGVKFSGTQLTRLSPMRAAASTPYEFDTLTNHTSGNLFEVKNQGTNKFVVDYLGNVTAAGSVTSSGAGSFTGTNNFNIVNANTLGVSNNITVLGIYQGTINADAAGTVLKQTKYLVLQGPNYGDGVGAIPQTNNYTVTGLMHYTFSGTAAASANYVRYEIAVPEDLDTAGTVKIARFKFSTSGTSTSQINWQAQLGQSAVSGARTPSFGTAITFNVTPSSVTANDIFEAAGVTLTGWAAALTPGNFWVIEIARDGTDSNNDSMTDAVLVLSYTAKSQ